MRPVSQEVFDVLALLTPYDIDHVKIRIGNDRDGGYVLANVETFADVLSFGVGPDVTFEHDMAKRGSRVFMYDHTVQGPPTSHDLFNFERIGICGVGKVQDALLTLHQHIENIGDLSRNAILKIDVEGYEWDVFSTVTADVLANFDQIVIEVHWLERLADPSFRANVRASLENINKQFSLFHVHGNNCTDLYVVDGFTVMSVLELSYIRSSLVNRRQSETVYPAPTDTGNHPGASDIPLLFFPFLPCMIPNDKLARAVERAIENRAASS